MHMQRRQLPIISFAQKGSLFALVMITITTLKGL